MHEFFNDYIQDLETYIMFRIKEEVARLTPELKAKNRTPIMLSMGAPTQMPPKFALDALKNAIDKDGMHTYSSPKGEKFFRDACALRMKNRFGVELNPDTEIFSLIGSKEGIANFLRGIINPSTDKKTQDIILIPDPGYASYKEMVKVSGGYAYPVPLTPENNFMPDMEEIFEKLVSEGLNPKKIKALLINYPNNPLGATATGEYLESVVKFCKKHKILLVSDAAYADIYFKDELKPLSILEIEGAKDIAVEFHSLSKPYAMTGWRAGWICGNEEAVKFFGKLKSTIDSGMFKCIQEACAKVMTSNEGDKYIAESNKVLKEKQELFVNGLKELGWKDFFVPDATFYLWIPIPPRYKTSVDFTNDLMRKSGVVAVPGNAFGQYGEGFCRISIVCSKEQLKEAIERMKTDGFCFGK